MRRQEETDATTLMASSRKSLEAPGLQGRGCEGCIKQRKQAWERSKAARCASTGEIAEAAMCLYCQESGRVHCVKWLGAQDNHS